MANERVKVLFIAGNGRSGSTILDVILGQLEGFFAVGELRRIWDRNLIEDRPCGCGIPFSSCPTWNSIFDEAYGGVEKIDPHEMMATRERHSQTKHLPKLLLDRNGSIANLPDVAAYLASVEKLYRAIRDVSGAKVIVDASKWPMYGYLVSLLPSVDLRIVHLVRDPRACAFSWARVKEYEPGELILRQGVLRSTAYWVTWNPSIERLWKRPDRRYMLLRYEDFILRPQHYVAEMVRLMDEEPAELPFVDEHVVELNPTHAVAGNIARLTRGRISLELDDEWKRKQPAATRLIVTALAWPWMMKYGYIGRDGSSS